MMKKVILGIALSIAGIIMAFSFRANSIKADGGIFYPKDYYSAETTQKAFIYFANQTENLVVLASFKGNAKDFAWVIPTPSKPEINKGSTELFDNLTKITKTTTSGPDVVYDSTPLFGLSGSSKSTVEVISEKTIDVYNTAVLKATDENALAKWLSDNGYSFPQDKISELKNYVDNGWYFAIAKIKPNLIGGGGIAQELEEGTLTPLRLTFQTSKIIYPMRLTGTALAQTVPSTITSSPSDNSVPPKTVGVSRIPITLYVLSDHKTQQSQLDTDWANWINSKNIKNLNDNLGSNIISGGKLFLTKMSASVSVTDIHDDFIVDVAQNDNVYPVPAYKTAVFWLGNLFYLILIPLILIFFPPLGLIFGVFVLLQIYVKKKWLYIIGSIYQILACLILLIIGLVVILENVTDLLGLLWQNGFIGGMIAYVVLLILGILTTIKIIKRYKITYKTEIHSPS